MKKKPVALLLSGVLLLGCTVGGTLAWLTAESETVNNTFTVGNIKIGLEETTGAEYLMTPGVTLAKDPTVTVKAGSEDCYVFIKVEESADFDTYMTYEIDPNNWTKLSEADSVYYTFCKDLTADRKIKVLLNEQIAVNGTITKEMMQSITDANKPTLTFTAYAIQLKNTNDTEWDAAAAWEAITN